MGGPFLLIPHSWAGQIWPVFKPPPWAEGDPDSSGEEGKGAFLDHCSGFLRLPSV